MAIRGIKILVLTVVMISCNHPYASFEYDGKAIYVCAQEGESIVTHTDCRTPSENHLLLLTGGFTGGMALYVDLCDAYTVKAFGDFEVVGDPTFTYDLSLWGNYRAEKDSLDNRYATKECRFAYKE